MQTFSFYPPLITSLCGCWAKKPSKWFACSSLCLWYLYFLSPWRLKITSQCPMNLINFPMDKQKCYLNIEACEWYSIFLTVSCFPEIYGCWTVANQLFFVLLSQLRWPRVDPSMVSQKPCDGIRQNSDPQLHFDILWSLFRHWGLLDWYDIIFWRLKAFTLFITPIWWSL